MWCTSLFSGIVTPHKYLIHANHTFLVITPHATSEFHHVKNYVNLPSNGVTREERNVFHSLSYPEEDKKSFGCVLKAVALTAHLEDSIVWSWTWFVDFFFCIFFFANVVALARKIQQPNEVAAFFLWRLFSDFFPPLVRRFILFFMKMQETVRKKKEVLRMQITCVLLSYAFCNVILVKLNMNKDGRKEHVLNTYYCLTKVQLVLKTILFTKYTSIILFKGAW